MLTFFLFQNTTSIKKSSVHFITNSEGMTEPLTENTWSIPSTDDKQQNKENTERVWHVPKLGHYTKTWSLYVSRDRHRPCF